MHIQHSLPPEWRRVAAEIYYEAFRQKLNPIIRSEEKGVRILEQDFDAEMGIVASMNGQLAGLAGVQYDDRHFVDFQWSTFRQELGWLGGTMKLALFIPMARRQKPGELLMDGIVVHPDRRGQGVGTRLLEAVFALAEEKGFETVRLDVVDTNPGARRLYERTGFVATETHSYPYLRRIMGFGAVTTMLKHI